MIDSRTETDHRPTSALLLGVMGCAGLGAAAGIDAGVFAVAHDAMTLPASVALVIVVLAPALYITVSMAGFAIRLPTLGAAILAGVRATGVAALGLMAPVLFLLASTSSPALSLLLVAAVLLFVGVLGLWAIHRHLFADLEDAQLGSRTAISTLYLVWSLVFLGIAARLILQNLVI